MNYIKYNGRRMCVRHWAREAGLEYGTLNWRINAGWAIERALTTPAASCGAKPGRKVLNGFSGIHTRIAKSHAALSEQLHRELRTFLKSFSDALILHAEVAALHLAQTHRRGEGANFVERPGTGGGSTTQDCSEIEFSRSVETKPCP